MNRALRSFVASNKRFGAGPSRQLTTSILHSGASSIALSKSFYGRQSYRDFHGSAIRAIESEPKSPGKQTKMRISDIMKGFEHKNFTISYLANIDDAVKHLVDQKLGSALVTGEKGQVLGIFTARDLLKFIKIQNHNAAAGRGSLSDLLAKTKITEVMTKREKLVYCSPTDSVKHCREIMFQLKIRNLPVLDGEEIRGIVTMKVLADSYFNILDIGGKKGFIHNVTGRKGLPDSAKVSRSNTSSSSPSSSPATPSSVLQALDMEVGAYALPHPFKREEGVAMNRRDYGAYELSTDIALCEDAHFAIRVKDHLAAPAIDSIAANNAVTEDKTTLPSADSILLPLSAPSPASQVYLCVADGVGSWRQWGVDPRQYSHSLVDNARRVVETEFAHRALIGQSPFDRDLDPIHPLDVMLDAWNVTTSEGINGSSTICIATLDKKLNQLSYSNIGDCGLLLLRHIDSETAGYMRERQLPRHLRDTDLRIAYLSQQQLRSFNLPYQLGFSNIPENPGSFETPNDADTASIPVMPGDLIIMATDGLFDNVDLHEIVDLITQWEKEHFPSAQGALDTSFLGHGPVQALAEKLVNVAREFSLDKNRDGPFALLAKENDIMWGGGMPDDTSVIVARIIKAEK